MGRGESHFRGEDESECGKMSWKEEFIARYGEAAWARLLTRNRRWQEANPEKVESIRRDQCRKGGKRYQKRLEYESSGLTGERNKVRRKHRHIWEEYKKIIAPDSQIHHEWIPETPNYKGVALVETDQHMHGIIKVIQILEGAIKVFTEREIQERNYVIE